MSSYDYDAYIGANGGREVRISRRAGPPWYGSRGSTTVVPVVDLKLDWTDAEPFEIELGDGLVVAVYPYHVSTTTAHPRHGKSTTSWRITGRTTLGLVSWGRCTAFVRRWGATMPLAIEDPRVLAALREREQFEALARLVVGDGE